MKTQTYEFVVLLFVLVVVSVGCCRCRLAIVVAATVNFVARAVKERVLARAERIGPANRVKFALLKEGVAVGQRPVAVVVSRSAVCAVRCCGCCQQEGICEGIAVAEQRLLLQTVAV